jgi:4-methylaminobutanoate oxidase (formaldehyde-forming)
MASEEIVKDSARIVIIGGGAIGCSIAYHLTKAGEHDIVLLEKSSLTHGCTWHAAGLVGQLRNKRNLTRMMQYSVEVCKTIETDTGQPTGFQQVGSLRVASSEARWQEIKRAASLAKSFGLEMHLISSKAAQERFPLMSIEGVVGAAFIPGDGYVDPYSLTHAYAKGAKKRGARFYEGVLVEDIAVKNGRANQVVTTHGTINCEIVVNAAGLWARQIGDMAGVRIPAGIVEHQYLVTEKTGRIPDNLPTFRDPDNLFYYKPEPGAFVLGGWEEGTKVCGKNGFMPFEFDRELFEADFDRFEQIIVAAAKRLPILNELGIRDMVNGPIPISPDGEPIMGPAPELENYYVACGFTSGIAASGGAGRAMAEWILGGAPSLDLWAFDIRRFGHHHLGSRYLHERSVESYAHYYKIHWPDEELKSARGGRHSPLHHILKAQGAVYGSKFGWERPNYFKASGAPDDVPSFTRKGWVKTVGEEHKAVRERVALIDQSSFSKIEVSGAGAFNFLQWLAVAGLDKPPGSVTYTQLCNERGGIEADLTIMRLEKDCFYVVTGSGFGVRDFHWIKSHMPTNGSVCLSDITSSKAVINLCGPLSRRVLEKLTDEDVSHRGFPFMQVRELRVGLAPVLAARLTYVGELGWELHMPVELLGRGHIARLHPL